MVTLARALILRAAGTNCEQETKFACEKVGFQAEIHHINRLLRSKELLRDTHLLIVPGGFSYGDDLGAGKVLGNEIRTKLLSELREFIARGNLILGICNGFQILTRAGLLPDPFADGPNTIALALNDSGRYEDRWVHLKVCSTKSPFLQKEEIIELPVAHGEGKVVSRDPGVVANLLSQGQVILKYVDPQGGEAVYPYNPNGSAGGIAGLCDSTGRVLGLMPHPERFQDRLNHPQWVRKGTEFRPDGLLFFQNAYEYVRSHLL